MSNNESPIPKKLKDRSPFPRSSLPQPGESLGGAAGDLVFNRVLPYAVMAVSLAMVATVEWISQWTGQRVRPWHWAAGAVVMGGIAGWRWYRMGPQLRRLH